MPLVKVERTVNAPRDAVFAQLSNMEQFPKFMSAVDEVTVVSRGEGWTNTRWVARIKGSAFRWIERDDFYPQEGRIAYQQVEGDLKKFEGEWRLAEAEGGATHVVLTVDFAFGIPALSSLLDPLGKVLIRQNANAMLSGLAEHLG